MMHNESIPVLGRNAYEAPDLRTVPIQHERGYATSDTLENVTEEETETTW